jgi:hypothetical protein
MDLRNGRWKEEEGNGKYIFDNPILQQLGKS